MNSLRTISGITQLSFDFPKNELEEVRRKPTPMNTCLLDVVRIFGGCKIHRSRLQRYALQDRNIEIFNIVAISGAYRDDYICSLDISFADKEQNIHRTGSMGEVITGKQDQICESYSLSNLGDRIQSLIIAFDQGGIRTIKMTTLLGECFSLGNIGFSVEVDIQDIVFEGNLTLKSPVFFFKSNEYTNLDIERNLRKLVLFEVKEHRESQISSNIWDE